MKIYAIQDFIVRKCVFRHLHMDWKLKVCIDIKYALALLKFYVYKCILDNKSIVVISSTPFFLSRSKKMLLLSFLFVLLSKKRKKIFFFSQAVRISKRDVEGKQNWLLFLSLVCRRFSFLCIAVVGVEVTFCGSSSRNE